MMLLYFQEMLRQMAIHFTVGEIQHVVFHWMNGHGVGFMMLMDNGEYWYATNLVVVDGVEQWPADLGTFSLYKYPPPIPAISDLKPLTQHTLQLNMHPEEINQYVKNNGGGHPLFLTMHDDY
jgi:hypothetical protein